MSTDRSLSMNATIPVLVCFDVEPDEREVDIDARADWVGFERAAALIDVLRPRMEAATGRSARVSWFLRMDPQITQVYGNAGWAADRYGALFDALVADGDELGLHVHPWQWDGERSMWMQNFADQSWVSYCVESAFAAFERAFGSRCRAFRFGDRWMNDETMALLERLGVTTDTTIEPGHTGTETPDAYTGTFPDYSEMSCLPYRPSRHDFRSPSEDGFDLLAIPIGCVPADWVSSPSVGASAALLNGAADYEGTLDAASMVEIAGWVWDRSQPDAVFDVEVLCDGESLATVGATGFRDDLADAGKGSGKHAFRLATPNRLKDGQPHVIRVRVAGTDVYLDGNPLVLQATADPDSDIITLYLDQHPFTFGLVVDRLLADPTTVVLTMKVRCDFATSTQRHANFRGNIEHLLAHPLARRFEFISPNEFAQRSQTPALASRP